MYIEECDYVCCIDQYQQWDNDTDDPLEHQLF